MVNLHLAGSLSLSGRREDVVLLRVRELDGREEGRGPPRGMRLLQRGARHSSERPRGREWTLARPLRFTWRGDRFRTRLEGPALCSMLVLQASVGSRELTPKLTELASPVHQHAVVLAIVRL